MCNHNNVLVVFCVSDGGWVGQKRRSRTPSYEPQRSHAHHCAPTGSQVSPGELESRLRGRGKVGSAKANRQNGPSSKGLRPHPGFFSYHFNLPGPINFVDVHWFSLIDPINEFTMSSIRRFQLDWLIDPSIDWSIDWLIDPSIDRLIDDWLIVWLIDWLIDWLMIDRLIVWLIDWLIHWSIDWSMIHWSIDFSIDLFSKKNFFSNQKILFLNLFYFHVESKVARSGATG